VVRWVSISRAETPSLSPCAGIICFKRGRRRGKRSWGGEGNNHSKPITIPLLTTHPQDIGTPTHLHNSDTAKTAKTFEVCKYKIETSLDKHVREKSNTYMYQYTLSFYKSLLLRTLYSHRLKMSF
jgi:hypothetical protein